MDDMGGVCSGLGVVVDGGKVGSVVGAVDERNGMSPLLGGVGDVVSVMSFVGRVDTEAGVGSIVGSSGMDLMVGDDSFCGNVGLADVDSLLTLAMVGDSGVMFVTVEVFD